MATPKTGVGLECNLIGLRVDEALEKLGKYLDDCLLMKYHQVRIIHGVGTGALREAVRKYLDKKHLLIAIALVVKVKVELVPQWLL